MITQASMEGIRWEGEGGLEQEFNLVVNICVGEAGDMGL